MTCKLAEEEEEEIEEEFTAFFFFFSVFLQEKETLSLPH